MGADSADNLARLYSELLAASNYVAEYLSNEG